VHGTFQDIDSFIHIQLLDIAGPSKLSAEIQDEGEYII
jgi:hypothetical protein